MPLVLSIAQTAVDEQGVAWWGDASGPFGPAVDVNVGSWLTAPVALGY